MELRHLACTTLVALLAIACTDANRALPSGPIAAARSTAAAGADQTGTPQVLRFAAGAPKLETYDTTFTVVQGVPSTHAIRFRDVWRTPYLVLAIPADAQFVDAKGNPLPDGATVGLRVRPDAKTLEVAFGPHGSTFGSERGTPAVLTLFFTYADRSGVDLSTTGLWHRASSADALQSVASFLDLSSLLVYGDVWHFSNYAVAYTKKR